MGLKGLMGAGVGSGVGAGKETWMGAGWSKGGGRGGGFRCARGVGPVMLQFLQLHFLEASRAQFGGGAVAGTTKQTVVLPDTPISVMIATAFPAADTPIAGNVAVAKQETAGTVHDWEDVGPNMVDHVSYSHPLREGPTEFQAYGQVWDCLSILVMVWEA
ncbi:hypothetical protein E2C01_076124 [Portunus trituberculatus]|uniref:Uncharacterized protein n=1 Tax=Portunus trituberculatus TaxID=210409 RepID=A0A5B7IGP6_PORTR|nr:hypothetical protein [Portunus trituberculatus]